jgi:hypothetical protein
VIAALGPGGLRLLAGWSLGRGPAHLAAGGVGVLERPPTKDGAPGPVVPIRFRGGDGTPIGIAHTGGQE